MRKLLLNRWLFFTAVLLMAVSCGDDEGNDAKPIASFEFETDETDWHTVHFTNFSQNANEFSWDFGDDSAESTEEDPSHTYAAGGTYTVTLTATGNGKSSVKTEQVIVTDPNEALRALTGDVSKSWKLLRDVSTGRYPMQVGPEDRTTIWWSFGGAEQLGVRPCALDDEFIFRVNLTYEYKTNGNFWAEGMQVSTGCHPSDDANYVNSDGVDVSAWNSGVHAFQYNVSAQTITLTGLGAWLGLPKVATDAEVTVPQSSVTYKVIKLHDGPVDTLIVETTLPNPGYWRFVLVHYDNPIQEPDMPGVVENPPLPTITPTALSHTFESAGSFVELGLIEGASIITPGEDDPDGGATKVGKFDRVATELFQEAQLRTSPELSDIVFTNFTTVSVDVYLPSSNTYDPLTKKVFIGFGDKSHTTEWWNSLTQYESDDVALDTWVTITFQLDAPTVGTSVLAREDLDMVFIQIGGGNHSTAATFYVRNLIFE